MNEERTIYEILQSLVVSCNVSMGYNVINYSTFGRIHCLKSFKKYKSKYGTFKRLVLHSSFDRFEIEKKLRLAKKKEQKKKAKKSTASDLVLKSASQRSAERRKNVDQKKDNKKFSALIEQRQKREEKKRIGEYARYCY